MLKGVFCHYALNPVVTVCCQSRQSYNLINVSSSRCRHTYNFHGQCRSTAVAFQLEQLCIRGLQMIRLTVDLISSSHAAEHIGQQLVASMICLKPWPPPRSTSNEPVPGLLGMSFSMLSLDDLFYVFLRLVSISLRFWNASDKKTIRRTNKF